MLGGVQLNWNDGERVVASSDPVVCESPVASTPTPRLEIAVPGSSSNPSLCRSPFVSARNVINIVVTASNSARQLAEKATVPQTLLPRRTRPGGTLGVIVLPGGFRFSLDRLSGVTTTSPPGASTGPASCSLKDQMNSLREHSSFLYELCMQLIGAMGCATSVLFALLHCFQNTKHNHCIPSIFFLHSAQEQS